MIDILILNVPSPDVFLTPNNYLQELPKRIRGVYLLYKNDTLMYIGKSNDLRTRLRNHLNSKKSMFKDCTKIGVYFIESQIDMDIYETYLINLMKPIHNKDKVYSDTDMDDSLKKLYSHSNLVQSVGTNNYQQLITELNKTNERLQVHIMSINLQTKKESSEIKKAYTDLAGRYAILNANYQNQSVEFEKLKESTKATQLKAAAKQLLKVKVNEDLLLFELEDSLQAIANLEIEQKASAENFSDLQTLYQAHGEELYRLQLENKQLQSELDKLRMPWFSKVKRILKEIWVPPLYRNKEA